MLRLLQHLSAHRHVLANFVARDLKIKYRGTVFGYLWSLLEPLSLVGIYWFLFVVIARRGGSDYPLVVILGLLPWNFFSGAVMACATALRANAGLILRVSLPREVFVIAAAASALVSMLLSMIIAVPLLVVYDVVPGPRLLLWPVAILLLVLLSIGIGLVVACANVIYRDVGYIIGVLLRIGIYLSAVVFPVDMVPEHLRFWFLFNPIATLLSMARNAVLDRPMPFETVHLVSAAALAVFSCVIGSSVFERWEKKAVKYL